MYVLVVDLIELKYINIRAYIPQPETSIRQDVLVWYIVRSTAQLSQAHLNTAAPRSLCITWVCYGCKLVTLPICLLHVISSLAPRVSGNKQEMV